MLAALAEKQAEIVVSADAQMDSPGHCAKYAQYTVMDSKTGYVLDTRLVDKREMNNALMVMKLHGFLRSLHFLLGRNLKIQSCVTDQHVCGKKFFCK